MGRSPPGPASPPVPPHSWGIYEVGPAAGRADRAAIPVGGAWQARVPVWSSGPGCAVGHPPRRPALRLERTPRPWQPPHFSAGRKCLAFLARARAGSRRFQGGARPDSRPGPAGRGLGGVWGEGRGQEYVRVTRECPSHSEICPSLLDNMSDSIGKMSEYFGKMSESLGDMSESLRICLSHSEICRKR